MAAFLINEQNMQQSKRFRDTLYIYVWSLKPSFYKLSSKNYLQKLSSSSCYYKQVETLLQKNKPLLS